MKELKDLTLQEYEGLKKSGLLWEFYPEATGGAYEDLEAVCVKSVISDVLVRDVLSADRKKLTEIKSRRFFYDIRDEEAEYDW